LHENVQIPGRWAGNIKHLSIAKVPVCAKMPQSVLRDRLKEWCLAAKDLVAIGQMIAQNDRNTKEVPSTSTA
jgi:hypothetical protein